MKKIMAVMLAAAISASLCACSGAELEKTHAEEHEAIQVVLVQNKEDGQDQPSAEEGEAEVSEDAYAGWFDDAVFVGDSVSVKLQNYVESDSMLGDAEFLCAVSLGYNNSLWELDRKGNVHPLYKGKKVTVDEGIKQTKKKKVFIMLGMNDIGMGVDFAIDGMKTLTDRIMEKNPGVQIYIQSVTPMLKNTKRSDQLNNKNIALFNEQAKEICKQRGYEYIDVASSVDDGHGNLLYDNCGDSGYMGLHFSNAGCEKWVKCLKAFAASKDSA